MYFMHYFPDFSVREVLYDLLHFCALVYGGYNYTSAFHCLYASYAFFLYFLFCVAFVKP
jgi:hypothetical protein